MEERRFLSTSAGRIGTLVFGFAVAGAGIVAFAGKGEHLLVAVPTIVLICIVGSILTVGYAVHEAPRAALALVIGLPFVAGFYLAALYAAAGAGTGMGAVFCAAGFLIALKAAFRPALRAAHRGIAAHG